MKYLSKLIARCMSSGHSESVAEDASRVDGRGGRSRPYTMWDEALMASESDENARRILEYWGPRWK
jgi:hypothetical protein